jgi:hypothetical protein
MPRRRLSAREDEAEARGEDSAQRKGWPQGDDRGEAEGPTNGSHAGGAPTGAAAANAEAGDESVRRAEEMIDRFAERVGHYTSVFGRKLLQLGARAREEAEDIWAEAQELRQRR